LYLNFIVPEENNSTISIICHVCVGPLLYKGRKMELVKNAPQQALYNNSAVFLP
jgi:hypothetical protein